MCNLCQSEDTEIDRAHVLKIYQSETKRRKERNALPLEIKQKIEQKQLQYQQSQQELQKKLQNQKLLEQQQVQQKQIALLKPKTKDFTSIAELFAEKRKELLGE